MRWIMPPKFIFFSTDFKAGEGSVINSGAVTKRISLLFMVVLWGENSIKWFQVAKMLCYKVSKLFDDPQLASVA